MKKKRNLSPEEAMTSFLRFVGTVEIERPALARRVKLRKTTKQDERELATICARCCAEEGR